MPALATHRRRPLLCLMLAGALVSGSVPPAHGQAAAASPSQAEPPASAPPPQARTAPTPQQVPLRLPALGESASEEFTVNTEMRVGAQIMREIRRDPDYLDDAPLLDYLQSIWQPLVSSARQRGDIGPDSERLFPYEAFLVRDRSVNAFALPGGYVGVHLGLIALTVSRDELASVLAHELSHVTQRHIARRISASQRSSTLSMAAMLLGLLAASRAGSGGIDMANAAIMGGQAAAAQADLNFSRDMEREADRRGHDLMTDAGFSEAGMAAMFEHLDQASRLNDSGGFPYLRSHPLTVERISEAQQRAGTLRTGGTAGGVTLMHSLMRARSRVLMEPSAQAWRRLQALDSRVDAVNLPLADRVASLYGGAFASVMLRDFERADRAAKAARALLAGSPMAADAQASSTLAQLEARLALDLGEPLKAQAALAGLDADRSRSVMLLRAQVALAVHDKTELRRNVEALQTWVSDHPLDASAWQLLANCADQLGLPLRAIRAEAESQAALGNLVGAIDRLRAGQQLARRSGAGTDFIEASVIDARLRALLAQRRQLMAEQGGSRSGQRPEGPE